MYVRKMDDGRFGVSMQFASDEEYFFDHEEFFDTLEEAIKRCSEEPILEYGISFDIDRLAASRPSDQEVK